MPWMDATTPFGVVAQAGAMPTPAPTAA